MAYKNPANAIPSPPPHDYDRQGDFTGYSNANPNMPVPGQMLDAEFNHVERALDETQDRLELIQRSDGALRNGSVHYQALHPSTVAELISANLNVNEQGIPAGGQQGQVLVKNSNTDWDTAWQSVEGSGATTQVALGTSPPAGPSPGDLWFDTSSARMFVFYQDNESSQWVQVVA
jgi:hypothetical protein